MTKALYIVFTVGALAAGGFLYYQNQELSKKLQRLEQVTEEQKDSIQRLKFSELFMAKKVHQLNAKLNTYEKINLSYDSLYFFHSESLSPQKTSISEESSYPSYDLKDTSDTPEQFIGLLQFIQNQNIKPKITGNELKNESEAPKKPTTITTSKPPQKAESYARMNFNALNLNLPNQLETQVLEDTKIATTSLKNLHYILEKDNSTLDSELKKLGYTTGENTTYYSNKNVSYCCFSIEKSAHKVSVFNSLMSDKLIRELQEHQIAELSTSQRLVYRYIWNSNIYELQYQTNYANQVKVSLELLHSNYKRR